MTSVESGLEFEIRRFEASHIADAARLFAQMYDGARQKLPLLPEHEDVEAFTAAKLEGISRNPGFVALDGGNLVGYMVELFTNDSFMSRPTGFVIELFPFAAVGPCRDRICQLLYQAMARSWIERGLHAHQISFFASDDDLAFAFYRLGFGMTHFQLFRDLTPPAGKIQDVEIRYLENEDDLREIEREHRGFYPNPPLLWISHGYLEDGGDLGESRPDRIRSGEVEVIAAVVDGQVAAYFDLSRGTAETELFVAAGNGQIKGAYGRPEYGGRGIGKALLGEAVRWARHHDLDRLYVEGESANIYGGNFWLSHFRPAEYSVRRCVDDRVRASMFTEE